MDFCVTVLTRLRGGHVNNLARAALDHDVTDTQKEIPEIFRKLWTVYWWTGEQEEQAPQAKDEQKKRGISGSIRTG